MKNKDALFDHELHLHLYGCLTSDFLWNLAQSKTKGRLVGGQPNDLNWGFFEKEYSQQFGVELDMANVLKNSSEAGKKRFKEIYTASVPGPFLQFQAKFNLIIAIADLKDTNEVKQVIDHVCQTHSQQGITHAEYRMMFPPWIDKPFFDTLLETMCQQLQQFETKSQLSGILFQGRLSLSIPRTDDGKIRYAWLRDAMEKHDVIAQMVTSIDFCFIEEGYPPKDKRAFFQKVLNDNQHNPEQALAILYHVAESFQDKSLESAIRWVHEAAEMGAHRLGHGIALGLPPRCYLGKTVSESIEERLDQIGYDIAHMHGLKLFDVQIDVNKLLQEKQELWKLNKGHTEGALDVGPQLIEQTYGEQQIKDLEQRQKYVISCLREMNVCVEVCPTSNLNIGMIDHPDNHPIHQFIQEDLPIIISSDDPGIFDTSLQNEVNWIKQHITDDSELLSVLSNNAHKFRSEVVSGRWPAKCK